VTPRPDRASRIPMTSITAVERDPPHFAHRRRLALHVDVLERQVRIALHHLDAVWAIESGGAHPERPSRLAVLRSSRFAPSSLPMRSERSVS